MESAPTTFISYNVNGIRSATNKGLAGWLGAVKADVVCFQEIKALEEQIDTATFETMGYHQHWFPAKKKGYSGVGIISKSKPLHVEYGLGIEEFDAEGRVIRADFPDFSVVSVYVPSGSAGEERQAYKMRFLADFELYINSLAAKVPALIVSGDFNICHRSIDIHNPVGNQYSSGFLPVERQWLGRFLDGRLVDSFREINNEPHQYSWWSYRFNARKKNLGWRIDYHIVSANLAPKIERAAILSRAVHSDHAPILLTIRI